MWRKRCSSIRSPAKRSANNYPRIARIFANQNPSVTETLCIRERVLCEDSRYSRTRQRGSFADQNLMQIFPKWEPPAMYSNAFRASSNANTRSITGCIS